MRRGGGRCLGDGRRASCRVLVRCSAEPDPKAVPWTGRGARPTTVGASWKQTEAGQGGAGNDYLVELGRQSPNLRTDVGAKKGNIDDLFVGGFLGVDGDVASGRLRYKETRSLKHIQGDFYIPPSFLDRFANFVASNFLSDRVQGGRVPLILGIWGPKGCGKSFQVELCCRKMGIEPIIMSAGELEDEWAGQPGMLIRERYRRAGEVVRVGGKMSALVINDLDAGCGRYSDTQVTVNNQMVMGTLMNICDHPERVSVGEEWRENDTCQRVPIIVTANDLSTLYAPLLRDGRMDKFYWQPSEVELVHMIHTMLEDDGVSEEDVVRLLQAFPDQPLDFFGALRARLYDGVIREWAFEDCDEEELPRRLQRLTRKDPATGLPRGQPDFSETNVDASFERLMSEANDLAREQQKVNDVHLHDEYLRAGGWDDAPPPPPPPPPPPTEEELAAAAAAREAARKQREEAAALMRELSAKAEAERAREAALRPPEPEPVPEPEPELKPWPELHPREVHWLIEEQGASLIDVRAATDFRKESAKWAESFPCVTLTGRPLHWETHAVDDEEFLAAVRERHPDPAQAKIVVLGGTPGAELEDCAVEALNLLVDAGYTDVAEVYGGYGTWVEFFYPDGRPRKPAGKYKSDMNAPGTVCVGAEFDPI